jgi:N-acetylmuramoyl-L-alanine amidase
MRNVKRMLVAMILAVGCVLPLAAPECWASSQVIGIRYWTAPDHTRIVIDLSGPSTYTHRVLTKPHRIVVEIPKTVFANKARRIEVNNGLIDRIRTNALRSGTAQIVVDLPEKPSYKTFALDKYPAKHKPDRIVIDVLRTVSEAEREAVKKQVSELKKRNKAIVVIDPGHGGEDPGAVARGRIYEKDLVLKVCEEIARLLKNDPGIEVFLTRNGDYSVSLRRRQRIARDMKADLFMSVHVNAAPAKNVRGAEVYFLSMKGASDAAARALAEAENAADLVGGASPESRSDIEAILCDLGREGVLRKSSHLALMVHEDLSRSNLTRMRRVKQARFQVLRTIEMPAVLVELGFLSNSSDKKNLTSASHQKKLAEALVRSIRRYFERFPAGDPVVHVVERGESLWRIAEAHGTTVKRLRELNDLRNADRILIGQKIRVQ